MPPALRDLDVRLDTARLTLRPLTEADIDEIWPYASDPDFPRHMAWGAHRSRDETLAWVKSCDGELARGTGITWTVREAGGFAGMIGLHGVTYQSRAWRIDRAEMGYWIATPKQRGGLCTEAARAVLGFAFGPMELRKVTTGCLAQNPASRRVIEKLGFRFLGLQKDHWGRDHEWHDHRAYEMTVGEHRASIGA